ncbi:hypothetical protein A1OK_21085 [Enterovibrio norvegicus FF-454]|uniref:AB hydrolase-1 domain-containing protein n=1 Tax=Enterovibrio norvegicus FF-454 TaxID=1185651 RepID=A0A1E5CC48_9GAMM|nr:alpha/beta hydrolase [Enterovibrio norvegicus]OEE63080.1 hypothetical protein A1OK_21085 [Enterovibrio norvegicus FF-454]
MKKLLLGILLSAVVPYSHGTEPSTGNYKSDVFFVGGEYHGEPGKELMSGQMYVERWTPETVTQPYPIVLIHGAAQTSVNWMTTPDGRSGWAHDFVGKGYVVYMVDQPARGRSAWHPNLNGELRMFNAGIIEKKFTASEQFEKQWPQSHLHTQWPGTGRKGDPVFDQFYASQVESLKSHVESSDVVRDAGVALLDKIGPAIILTHSQSGPFGWLIADARPELVMSIVTMEPSGPPIQNKKGKASMPWGVTVVPITYSPGVSTPADLVTEQQANADRPDLIKCWQQTEPAKQLVNLKDTPVLFLISESSYHAEYDHCTAKWLTQAGVDVDLVRLEDEGIRGNGHMLMLENNHLDIANWITTWVGKNVQ